MQTKNNWTYRWLGHVILLFVFVISIFIRNDYREQPLGDQEWITAHALITTQIWADHGGPLAYNFNPVYTKPGKGNNYRDYLGGVFAENGDVYYVSYPPLSFYFLYYGNKFLGGQTIQNTRTIGLILHLVSALLLLYLIQLVQNNKNENHFNFGGIITACLYLLMDGFMWIHGHLFFVDIMVIPLFLLTLIFAVRFWKNLDNWNLFFLCLFIFLASYTEWLGVFSGFILGITSAFIAYKEKKKRYLFAFIGAGLSTALAIGLTLIQYSSIAGWKEFFEQSRRKFIERSGHGQIQDSSQQFNLHNSDSFEYMINLFDGQFRYLWVFTLIVLFVYFIMTTVSKNKLLIINNGEKIFFAFAISILMHYLLFYNFNVMHSFGGLKTAVFFLFIAGILINKINEKQIIQPNHFKITLIILAVFCASFSIHRFTTQHKTSASFKNHLEIAKFMRNYDYPNWAYFSNIPVTPQYVFYANHCYTTTPALNYDYMSDIMDLRRNDTALYFHQTKEKLTFIQEIYRKNDQLIFGNKVLIP